ncbi:processed acidic surface protein [Siminovitchia sp. 179-K 8D1 HS]|uniref:processed acidic surface protein n=1 Tax=Siminovitchia sp. 179-K 8D1 HS TaxID=3142385 RepID=UPI0039A304CD
MKKWLSVILALVLAANLLPLAAFAAVDAKDPKFQSYLKEIGMSEQEFITYLQEFHDYTLEDFTDLADLKDYLGDPLNEENLKELLADFELTKAELEQLLQENGMSLDEFTFINDLDFVVSDLLDEGLTEEDLAEMEQEILMAFSAFGIDKAEADRLRNHLDKVIEKTGEEAFLAKLESLAERLEAFPEFESASELSAAQIAELLSIWEELLNTFQVKAEYFLVKDGVETPVSLSALIKMDDINGADLLIKIYSAYDGQFLADVLITKEMFGSDLIKGTGKKTKKAAKTVAKKVPAKKAPVARTVKGGKLPNTASDYIPNALAGFAFIILGAFLFRRFKAKGV